MQTITNEGQVLDYLKLEEVTGCPLEVDALAADIARYFGDGD